jgi:(p)ppGpp synthase/HD superfamily hydrolase
MLTQLQPLRPLGHASLLQWVIMAADDHLAHPLSARFDDALVYASTLHRTQSRKGTQTPYVAHLLSVAGLVIEHGGQEDQAIAALLHDAIEDQGEETGPEILRRYGQGVYAIVKGCTDSEVPKGAPKPPWLSRKEAYIEHARHAPATEKLVSAADKLHNARSILSDYRYLGDAVWARFSGRKEGTLWYYRTLVGALGDGETEPGLARLVAELDRVVTDLEKLAG